MQRRACCSVAKCMADLSTDAARTIDVLIDKQTKLVASIICTHTQTHVHTHTEWAAGIKRLGFFCRWKSIEATSLVEFLLPVVQNVGLLYCGLAHCTGYYQYSNYNLMAINTLQNRISGYSYWTYQRAAIAKLCCTNSQMRLHMANITRAWII